MIVTIEDVTYDLSDYLGMLISARWEAPETNHPVRDDEKQVPESRQADCFDPLAVVDRELAFQPEAVGAAPISVSRPQLPPDQEYVATEMVPISPQGKDSEHIISKSIERLEIIDNVFVPNK